MNYWNIYKDVWDFHKKYSDTKEDDGYWQSLINDSDCIAKKYNDNKFVVSLLVAVLDEISRCHKEMISNADRRV